MVDIPTVDLVRFANNHGYKNIVVGDNIDYKEVKRVLHRLNDRLQQFQKRGYTDSADYDRLVEKLSVIGKGVKFNTKTGRLTFSESVKGLTNNDIKLVLKMGGTPINKKSSFEQISYGQARINATKTLKKSGNKAPTETDIKMTLAKEKRVHEFIINHALDIYQVQELSEAIHRPWNEKLTLQEVDALLTMYDNPNYYDDAGNFIGNVKRDSQGIIKKE